MDSTSKQVGVVEWCECCSLTMSKKIHLPSRIERIRSLLQLMNSGVTSLLGLHLYSELDVMDKMESHQNRTIWNRYKDIFCIVDHVWLDGMHMQYVFPRKEKFFDTLLLYWYTILHVGPKWHRPL